MIAFALLPLFIFALVVAVCGRSIWVTVMPPRGGVKVPSCERCKYPVAGLSVFRCPECGSDWRVVGIVTRAMEVRRRGGLLGAITAWTFLCLVGWYLASVMVLSSVGRGMVMATAGPVTTTTSFTPASGAYRSLALEQVQRFGSGVGPDAVIEITLGDGSVERMEVFAGRRRFRTLHDGEEVSNGSFNRSAVVSWFDGLSLDTSNAAVGLEADEAFRMADLTLALPHTPPSAMSVTGLTMGAVTTSNVPATAPRLSWWYTAGPYMIGAGVMFVVYALGVVFIVRRRRKLLREADAPYVEPTRPPPPLIGGGEQVTAGS